MAIRSWISKLFTRAPRTARKVAARYRPRLEALEDRLTPSAIITVNSLDDGSLASLAGDGKISLREAIEAANTDTSVDGSVAGDGADTIVFDSGVFATPRTITLLAGELAITSDLKITGPGAAKLTISGNDANRIFRTSGSVEIVGLTLIDGAGTLFDLGKGGAIYNQGDLTLTDCTLSGNSNRFGGGLYNEGIATLTGCTLDNNSTTGSREGGGIYNVGTLTLTDCTLTNNSSGGRGGGIYNDRTATLTGCTLSNNHGGEGGAYHGNFHGSATFTDCTFSDNTASSAGGAVFLFNSATLIGCTLFDNTSAGNGGGVLNNGALTIINCTLSGNEAGGNGGGIWSNVNATLTNCTLSGNSATGGDGGGGIFTSTSGTRRLRLDNTIVANSTAGEDIVNLGTPITGSNNLVEDGSGGLADTITGDPNLAPLEFYGGPTKTHALRTGSPAIDVGENTLIPEGVDTDQRGGGFDRIVNDIVDIGAFEVRQHNVIIDVRPEINLAGNGVIALSLYGSASFAVSAVNLGSLRLSTAAGSADLPVASSSLTDLNGDGHRDLVLHFRLDDVRALLLATYGDLLEAADTNDANNVLDAGVSTHQSAALTLSGDTSSGDIFAGADLTNLFLAGRTLTEFLAALQI